MDKLSASVMAVEGKTPLSSAHPSTTQSLPPPVPGAVDDNNTRRPFYKWRNLSLVCLAFALAYLLFRNFEYYLVPLAVFNESGPPALPCENHVNWTMDLMASGSGFPYHAKTTLLLPVSAATNLSFLSQGQQQFGKFVVSQDLDKESSSILVDILIAYRRPGALDEVTVCRIHTENSTWGVGISTNTADFPFPFPSESEFDFQITVHLPVARKAGKPVAFRSLQTNMPLFEHHLPDLAKSAYFDSVSLRALNRPIVVGSLAGADISLFTSNGAIRGSFNASASLSLTTSNAPMVVSANLTNGNNERRTLLSLKNSNSLIDSTIALRSNTSDGTHGWYTVSASSVNAPVHLAFVDAPVDSRLRLEARTTGAPVDVTLHPTYEGEFDLYTSSYDRPEVIWSTDAEDPAGKGRIRGVHLDTIKDSRASGYAVWEAGGERKGSVILQTMMSPLTLTL